MCFFFFKQKTAYELRISDWSSDVCSSDLVVRASIRLVRDAMRVRRLDLAILCISFFWAVGTILASQFPPLVKNEFNANQQVATLFLALFSVGVAVGSIAINRLLKGEVSARFRSEEHTSELQSLMRISYAVFCLKKKKK